MKNSATWILSVCLCLIGGFVKSQLNFTLSPQSCQNQSLSLSVNPGSLSPNGYTWTSIPNGVIFSSPNTSVSALSFTGSGIYTISILISSSSGTASSSKTISVIPFPISALTPLSQTICPGQTATLIASGAGSYTWLPTSMLVSILGSSVVASPSISSVYSVTGSSSLCGTSSLTFSVAVNNFPNLSYSASSFSICEGQTANLAAFGALSYTWLGTSFSVGITQPTIAVGAGNYTLVGSNGGSCTNTLSSIVISSVNCTGVEKLENTIIHFKLFPNPVFDKLYISSKNRIPANIEILDVLGKVIFTTQIEFMTTPAKEIDVHGFPASLYYLRLSTALGSSQVLSFIKE